MAREWTTRLNPHGPVGATHVHGFTDADADADVRGAPRFADLIPQVNGLLAGRAVAAHDARFTWRSCGRSTPERGGGCRGCRRCARWKPAATTSRGSTAGG